MTKTLSIIATDPSFVGIYELRYEVFYIDGHTPSSFKDFKVKILATCNSDLLLDQSILKPIPEISAYFDIHLGSFNGSKLSWGKYQVQEQNPLASE